MEGKISLQMLIAGMILTTAVGREKFIAPLLPAFPIPTVKPTSEYSPPKPDIVPVCQVINVNHSGIKLPQESGEILVCHSLPTPTMATNNFGTTTNTVVKTTNTTTTEVRTVTTTTTTTIEATTTSTNTTVPMDVKPCALQGGSGAQYNWWQILTESGGKPGALKRKIIPYHVVDSPPVDPCDRPLQSQNPNKYTYKFREKQIREEESNFHMNVINVSSSSSGYIREEIGYSRMLGTANEFLDVRGDFIWKPPTKMGKIQHTYSVYYILDDTGFWANATPLVCSNDKLCSLSHLASYLNPLRGKPFSFDNI